MRDSTGVQITAKYPRDLTDEEQASLFISDDGSVINLLGENYYLSCPELVWRDDVTGVTSYCVKPINHPTKTHEDYRGMKTRSHDPMEDA